MCEENGTLELQLANGKSLVTRSEFEMACFLASAGSSITPLPKGGKSKGGRGRGRKKVRQPRVER